MAVVARTNPQIAYGACLSSDSVGDIVYIRDEFTGTRYRVEAADPSDSDKMPGVAVILSKQSPTACIIQFQGFLDLYTGLTPGEPYFVGTDSIPAKVGDANFPGVGNQKQQIGVAVDVAELLFRAMDVVGEVGTSGGRYHSQSITATGDPQVFTSAILFQHGGMNTEKLIYNGQELLEGAGNDYIVSESGGAGTGYDTITLGFIPMVGANWKIDFAPHI
jgi:hypothetical protein